MGGGGDIENNGKRDSSVGTQEASEGDEDEKLFLRKASSSMSRRLRRPRCSLAAFSELSLSRSSFRLEQDDDR